MTDLLDHSNDRSPAAAVPNLSPNYIFLFDVRVQREQLLAVMVLELAKLDRCASRFRIDEHTDVVTICECVSQRRSRRYSKPPLNTHCGDALRSGKHR